MLLFRGMESVVKCAHVNADLKPPGMTLAEFVQTVCEAFSVAGATCAKEVAGRDGGAGVVMAVVSAVVGVLSNRYEGKMEVDIDNDAEQVARVVITITKAPNA